MPLPRCTGQAGQLGFDGVTTSEPAVDVSTEYGAEVSPVMPDVETTYDSLHTVDPLELSPLLQSVRDVFLLHYPLESSLDGITPRSSTYEKFRPAVQQFQRYRAVCDELVQLVINFFENGVFDWDAFGESDSSDAYSQSVQMRKKLGAIGAGIQSGTLVLTDGCVYAPPGRYL